MLQVTHIKDFIITQHQTYILLSFNILIPVGI